MAPFALAIALTVAYVPKVAAESVVSIMTAFVGSTLSTRILTGPLDRVILLRVSPGAMVLTVVVTEALAEPGLNTVAEATRMVARATVPTVALRALMARLSTARAKNLDPRTTAHRDL